MIINVMLIGIVDAYCTLQIKSSYAGFITIKYNTNMLLIFFLILAPTSQR